MGRVSKYKTYADFMAIRDMHPVCFDLETTGLSRKTDRILSFSAIRLKWEGRFVGESKVNVFFNPGFHIPDEVSRINHITDEDVKDCMTEDVLLPKIRRFLGEHPVLCGYNSNSFDVPFLNAAYERVFGEKLEPVRFDVMHMAKELLDCKNYKLENVAHECGCDMDLSFHRSMDDVIATVRVMNTLAPLYQRPVPARQVEVLGLQRFYRSHVVNRIYVNTYPVTKTFYDVYRGEWKSNCEIDFDRLRRDVLEYSHCSDESQLVRCVI